MCDSDLCLKSQTTEPETVPAPKKILKKTPVEEPQEEEEEEEEAEEELCEEEEEDSDSDDGYDSEEVRRVVDKSVSLGQFLGIRNTFAVVSVSTGIMALTLQTALYFVSYLI